MTIPPTAALRMEVSSLSRNAEGQTSDLPNGEVKTSSSLKRTKAGLRHAVLESRTKRAKACRAVARGTVQVIRGATRGPYF